MAAEDQSCESLKLGNQVCFPLYACSKELIRQYGPYLKEMDLTYTQYLVMMVLWEKQSVTVKDAAINALSMKVQSDLNQEETQKPAGANAAVASPISSDSYVELRSTIKRRSSAFVSRTRGVSKSVFCVYMARSRP